MKTIVQRLHFISLLTFFFFFISNMGKPNSLKYVLLSSRNMLIPGMLQEYLIRLKQTIIII